MTQRTDSIGQPLAVGEIIVYNCCLRVITKIHPKTVRIDAGGTISDCEVVIVTSNLIALGQQDKVDQLRADAAHLMDHVPPKTVSVPIRYFVVRDNTHVQYLLRFEQNRVDDARDAWSEFKKEHPGECEFLSKSHNWIKQYWIPGNASMTRKDLPSSVAAYSGDDAAIIQILPADYV